MSTYIDGSSTFIIVLSVPRKYSSSTFIIVLSVPMIIFLKMPAHPCAMIRAEMVSKQWARFLKDRFFLKDFFKTHKTPPLVGCFTLSLNKECFVPCGDMPDLVNSSAFVLPPAPSIRPPGTPRDGHGTLMCAQQHDDHRRCHDVCSTLFKILSLICSTTFYDPNWICKISRNRPHC
jgi:hypothetical protein